MHWPHYIYVEMLNSLKVIENEVKLDGKIAALFIMLVTISPNTDILNV